MEKDSFRAVLKRSVTMFNMLTGRDLTEREGSAFIQIFDLVDEYHAPGGDGNAADTFNTLSMVQPEPGLRERPAAKTLQDLNLDIPAFIGRKTDEQVKVFADAMSTGTGAMYVGADGVWHLPHEEVLKAPDEQPVDLCGCPFGRCTCTDEMLKAARQTDIKPEVLTGLASRESAQNKTPIGGIVETESGQFKDGKRYIPPPIRTATRDHIQGYDWQIVVLDRWKDTSNSYAVHFAEMPTQREFDEHFAKYHQRTHYVHVNEWVNFGWEGITERYDRTNHLKLKPSPEVSAEELRVPDKVVRVAPAPELKGRDVSAPALTDPWEQPEKPFRIRYYSDVLGAVTFHYTDKKPTGAEMAHFHHTKCLAVSQAKPKD